MSLDIVLETITPFVFAKDYARSVTEEGSNIFCYFDNIGKCRIHGGGYVIDDSVANTFIALSVVDALVIINSGKNRVEPYLDAVSTLLKKYQSVLPPGLNRELVAREARLQRRIYNSVVCTGVTEAPPIQLVPILHKLTNNNPKVGTISALNKQQMQELIKRLNDFGTTTQGLTASPAIVVPYFDTVYSVGCIEVYYPDRCKEVIWLTYSSIVFSSLPVTRCGARLAIEPDIGHTLLAYKTGKDSNTDYTNIKTRPGDSYKYIPTSVIYVNRGGINDALQVAKLVTVGVKCAVVNKLETAKHFSQTLEEATTTHNWNTLAVDLLKSLLDKSDKITQDIQLLLDTLQGDDIAMVELMKHIDHLGKYWLKLDVQNAFRKCVVPNGSNSIYEDGGGYLDSANTYLTNFTLTPVHSIIYNSGEIFYKLKLTMSSMAVDITLPASGLETIKKLADNVRAQAMIASMGSLTVFPTIYNTTKANAILPYLHRVFSEYPKKIGTSVLGWSGTREVFNSTYYKCDKGVSTLFRDPLLRPGVQYFNVYKSSIPEEGSMPAKDVPEPLMNVIYACCCIIGRYYANYALTPFCCVNTLEARLTLTNLFSYIGQESPVMLNQNMRSIAELNCFAGFPYVAIGYNKNQAKQVKAGMILLGETGEEIDNYDVISLKSAGLALRYVVELLPYKLLKDCGLPFVPSDEPICNRLMITEGKLLYEYLLEN